MRYYAVYYVWKYLMHAIFYTCIKYLYYCIQVYTYLIICILRVKNIYTKFSYYAKKKILHSKSININLQLFVKKTSNFFLLFTNQLKNHNNYNYFPFCSYLCVIKNYNERLFYLCTFITNSHPPEWSLNSLFLFENEIFGGGNV